MASKTEMFKTVTFEEGTSAVVRTDPRQPSQMVVIATFYDAARAREYANAENAQAEVHDEKKVAAPKKDVSKRNGVTSDLSERQSSVLEALHTKMDHDNLVEVRAAVLAEAANIPLGSLHSVLGSLEKKHLIETARSGTAKAPAVYKVL
jgi:DNA-binding MarR family transcriptional regulator